LYFISDLLTQTAFDETPTGVTCARFWQRRETMTSLTFERLTTTSTLPNLCFSAIRKHRKADALNHKRDGSWVSISAEEFVERVTNVALGLRDLGVRAGDRIALLSENRPEWSIVDLAMLCLRAVSVPIYTTQAVDQVRYILENSGARFLFVSGKRVLKHAMAGLAGVETVERLIFFDKEAGGDPDNALSLQELEQRGAEIASIEPELLNQLISEGQSNDLATVIYTSGTTGEPKGVMLSHANFVSNVLSVAGSLPISHTDLALSVLPLSHIFERTVFYVFCFAGVSVYYAASFDHVGDHLREVRPTVMTAVPRLFEKVFHRIVKKGMSAGGWQSKLFARSLTIGQKHAERKDKRERVSALLAVQYAVASRVVFSKWREGVGGRLRYFVSGGAPLSPALSYAFWAAGIPILQGYGMTEGCIVSANRPDDNRVGSVGLPLPGVDVKIANDGEILIHGPNVMQGYYHNDIATKEALIEGWYHTGDVGMLDADGHLYITDRKKDLFKLSNGKYIAPQQLESLIKQSEYVNQVVVIGAGRKFPAALIVPEWDALLPASGIEGMTDRATRARLSRDPAIVKRVQSDVLKLTAELGDYERVRRVALLTDEFSIDRGELTPTLKVKRGVIDEKYGDLIAEIYGSG
jgi:long-chain acyl-CoA synthetase